MKHWIIVADASGARIFSATGMHKSLELVKEMQNPDGRKRTQDLVSDEPGRTLKARSAGSRSGMDPRTNAHDSAAEQFARDIAEYLRKEMPGAKVSSFSMVAPPGFLGTFKPLLVKDVEQRFRGTLAKDLVHVPAADLRGHLDSVITPELFL